MSAVRPAPDGLDHVAITVRDMDRALAFYQGLLGCEVLGELMLDGGARKLVYLRAGAAQLELFADRPPAGSSEDAGAGAGSPPSDPPALGFQHVAFHTGDVDGVAARLRGAGVTFHVGPLDATGNVRLAFVRDPDGNLVELVSRLPDMRPYRSGWD